MIADENYLCRLLTDEEVLRMSTCFDAPFGNILDWSKASWGGDGHSRVEQREGVETSDFCSELPPKQYTMFPERRAIQPAHELCLKVGEFYNFFNNSFT